MNKKVLIISTSPRAGSNSELLACEFGRGAKDSGNEVEIVSLKDKGIRFCRGCFACQKTQRCVIRDDADLIEKKMEKAAADLNFEAAAEYRDRMIELKGHLAEIGKL